MLDSDSLTHWTHKIGSLNQNISPVMYKTTIAWRICVKIVLNMVKASKVVQMKPITEIKVRPGGHFENFILLFSC